jgi:hypothetical protein
VEKGGERKRYNFQWFVLVVQWWGLAIITHLSLASLIGRQQVSMIGNLVAI